jgi:hypothetical protein
MKRYYFPLLLGVLMPRLTAAQEAIMPAVIEKVSYVRSIPNGLTKFVPRGGKSRFWGESKLTYQNQKVWLHVYDVKKTRFRKDETNVTGKQDSGLDLFTLSKSRQLKRISSTRFTYGRYGGYKRGGDFETVGVQTLYLDPKSQKMPIIQIAFQDPNGLYGTITEYAFIIFNQGLNAKPIVQQQFGYGSSNGAGWNTWRTEFGTDEMGLLTINFREGSMDASRVTIYKWINNYFRPFERKQRSNQIEDAQEETVPLTDLKLFSKHSHL